MKKGGVCCKCEQRKDKDCETCKVIAIDIELLTSAQVRHQKRTEHL